MTTVAMLKKLISEPGIIVAAGCYDGLSAKLVEKVGFKAAYMTGFGSSGAILGKPDYGFVNMFETVTHARNLAGAIKIPLIADADTGYGNPLNVMRTVQELEKAGVAAIHIEDQVFPKRCGHMEGKEVIPMQDHISKIKAAVDSRKELLIIARTDSRTPLGIEEAIERAIAYYEAGADIVFVDAPQSEEEIYMIADKVKAPLFINMVEGGKTPILPANELEKIGYKIVIYPLTALMAATKAMEYALKELYKTGTTNHILHDLTSFQEYNKIVGLEEIIQLERKYSNM